MTPFRLAAGETALVVGLGRSGRASARVLAARGLRIYAVDEQSADALRDPIAALEASGGTFVRPDELGALAHRLDVAILSPGVPRAGALVQRLLAAGVPVVSEVEAAYRICDAPIAAVTGTKGKSTTVSLIGHLLRCAGRNPRVGGNIGDPLIDQVLDVPPGEWVVAELSSFQLESVQAFHPRISVLLNIEPDHLDRYESLDAYAAAKYRIFANQEAADTCVANLDDPRLARLLGSPEVRARQTWYSVRDSRATMYVQGKSLIYDGGPSPARIADLEKIPLLGIHNVQNVMAACLTAIAAGVDPEALREGIESFAPMHHRLQQVCVSGGIAYVDDSKATSPGAAIAALESFDRNAIVLVAGGKSKNTDFTELGRAIDARAKAVVLIGEAAPEIARHVRRAAVERATSIADAVRKAREHAKPGDVVLLSPACASFDMFESAEDRGRQFTRAVRAAGEPLAS